MLINTCVVNANGAQETRQEEVPDDYVTRDAAPYIPDPIAALEAIAVDQEYRITLLELGVSV